jgi:hypothetical protein
MNGAISIATTIGKLTSEWLAAARPWTADCDGVADFVLPRSVKPADHQEAQRIRKENVVTMYP